MPTARGGYFVDGERVPSVTTILGKFKDPGGLMYWAWAEGKAGRDFRETRDKAADAGTIAHAMVECDIRGKAWAPDGQPEDVLEKAKRAFGSYLEWKAQTQLKAAETELPLVSKKFRFGGTLDALLVRGKLAMGDWKTSNAVYAEYLMQIAAYAALWEENFPERPIEGGFHLLRFSKEDCDFTHHFFAELDDALGAFLCLRNAYELVEKLKRRVK